MPREDNSISASELEVMRVLWAAGEPLSIAEIRESLADTGWEASTIKTLVARLVKKASWFRANVACTTIHQLSRARSTAPARHGAWPRSCTEAGSPSFCQLCRGRRIHKQRAG